VAGSVSSTADDRDEAVALPHAELGRRAVELLLAPPEKPVVERIPMRLHERGSVAPPRY